MGRATTSAPKEEREREKDASPYVSRGTRRPPRRERDTSSYAVSVSAGHHREGLRTIAQRCVTTTAATGDGGGGGGGGARRARRCIALSSVARDTTEAPPITQRPRARAVRPPPRLRSYRATTHASSPPLTATARPNNHNNNNITIINNNNNNIVINHNNNLFEVLRAIGTTPTARGDYPLTRQGITSVKATRPSA